MSTIIDYIALRNRDALNGLTFARLTILDAADPGNHLAATDDERALLIEAAHLVARVLDRINHDLIYGDRT